MTLLSALSLLEYALGWTPNHPGARLPTPICPAATTFEPLASAQSYSQGTESVRVLQIVKAIDLAVIRLLPAEIPQT
jgi:hypothetical protein